jgi:hypothetical protein
MIRIKNFFMILFMEITISEANFIRFAEDHLQRLIANNAGGVFTPLINLLTSVLNEMKAAIESRDWNQTQQESKTITVDSAMSLFKSKVSRSYTDITDHWDEGSDTFELFFPHGLDEYSKANKGNIESLMARWISACENQSAVLGAEYSVPFKNLKENYKSQRSTQLNLIGNVDGNRLDVARKKQAVAQQLTRNVHAIGTEMAGNMQAVTVYFDESIIRRPVKQNGVTPEPEIYSEAVAPETMAVILHGKFDANTMFHIVNTGSVNLKFYTANMPEDPVPGTALELAPGEEDEAIASDLGASTNLFLMAYNGNQTTAGSYEVSILTD